MKRHINFFVIAAFIVLATLSGCGGPSLTPFASKEFRRSEGMKMAVLPFDNLSKTQGAGKTMETYVLVELLKHTGIKIVDPGEVAAVLSQERIRLATSIPRETLIRLGKSLGVDLFLMGVVHEYEMQLATGAGGSGQIPVVAVTLRAIDAATGDIVWAINAPRRGNDSETVFGVGRIQSLDRLAQETARDASRAFASSLGR